MDQLIAYAVPLMFLILAVQTYCTAGTWSLAHFAEYIAAMARQNLPLGSSLSAYAQDLPGWRTRKRNALIEIADMVDNGRCFADALDRHPGIFPRYYRALVRAGENGGNLDALLRGAADIAGFHEEDRRRFASTMPYPLFLIAVALPVIAVVMVVVFPQMDEMYIERESTALRMLFGARTLGSILLPVLFVLVALVFFGPWVFRRLVKSTSPLGRAWSWLLWHAPLVRRAERRRAISQYALAAARLMEAGLPTHDALCLAADASGNTHFDGLAREAAAHVAEGETLSRSLAMADRRCEIPPEFTWFVEVGERAGRLPEALLRASESASTRARSALRHLADLLCPASILAVAVVVGMMAYGMFGAIVELMEGLL